MKWTNKGTKFDNISNIIIDEKSDFYLWGAKETGDYFLKRYKKSIKIKGIIDSDITLVGKEIYGIKVFTPEIINEINDIKIIITVSSPSNIDEIIDYLNRHNKIENKDYFSYINFMRLYDFYKNDKLNLINLDLILTNSCTLACEKCLLKIPFVKTKKIYNIDQLKKSIDEIFNLVDYFEEIHLLGGEPLLYENLIEIISYIANNYRKKFSELQVVSNGTIIPKRDLMAVMKSNNVRFIISDYSVSNDFNGKQYLNEIKTILKEYEILFSIRNQDYWHDYDGDFKNEKIIEKELVSLYDKCPCRKKTITVIGNKLYSCCRAASLVWGNLKKEDINDYFELDNDYINKRKYLLEFSLGCTEIGYLKKCYECYSNIPIYERIISAAKQIK